MVRKQNLRVARQMAMMTLRSGGQKQIFGWLNQNHIICDLSLFRSKPAEHVSPLQGTLSAVSTHSPASVNWEIPLYKDLLCKEIQPLQLLRFPCIFSLLLSLLSLPDQGSRVSCHFLNSVPQHRKKENKNK